MGAHSRNVIAPFSNLRKCSPLRMANGCAHTTTVQVRCPKGISHYSCGCSTMACIFLAIRLYGSGRGSYDEDSRSLYIYIAHGKQGRCEQLPFRCESQWDTLDGCLGARAIKLSQRSSRKSKPPSHSDRPLQQSPFAVGNLSSSAAACLSSPFVVPLIN